MMYRPERFLDAVEVERLRENSIVWRKLIEGCVDQCQRELNENPRLCDEISLDIRYKMGKLASMNFFLELLNKIERA